MAVISADRFNPLARYVGVRLQQGVPIVDADWNELEDIRSFEVRAYLKWFVGDGIPEGNDGFEISGSGLANDFSISAGVGAAPPVSDVERGLRFVGRCIVDGRDAIIETDTTFRSQALHTSQPNAAALAADWGVPVVPELPAVDATLLVYLDVWDQLFTPSDPGGDSLIFPDLGTESCARLQRHWAVRFRTGSAVPANGDPDFLTGHSYCPLATLVRRSAVPNVAVEDVTDLRERRLLMLPATLTEDLLGLDTADYRRGLGRPPVSLREAINALIRGELPASAAFPIAPAPGGDAMSYAIQFVGQDVVAFWHSDRSGAINQVFATRFSQSAPNSAALSSPVQVSAGLPHRLPHSVRLPTGDFLVVYETNARDIHFKRAPDLTGLAGAVEVAVADDPALLERHPFVVVSNLQVVFFWHRLSAPARWVYRRRQYTPSWLEADAIWLDPAGVELSPLEPAAPPAVVGDFHAVVDAAGQIYANFRTSLSTSSGQVAVVRLNPAVPAIETWADQVFGTPGADQQSFLLREGNTAVWAFFRAGADGIFQARFDVATNTWGAASLVPGTDAAGDIDARPCAVIDGDGAIWLLWASERGTSRDIWLARRNPVSGAWGELRQVVAAPGVDDFPFALNGQPGVLWLFWQRQAGLETDLFFKTIVTVI